METRLEVIVFLAFIGKKHQALIIISPATAVAKYSDEHTRLSVCLSVCLSSSISPESQARSLPNFVRVAHGCGSVLLWQGDEIPRGRGNFVVSSSLTMHCNAFAAKGIIQYRPRRGLWECTARAKCDLRLPCCRPRSRRRKPP